MAAVIPALGCAGAYALARHRLLAQVEAMQRFSMPADRSLALVAGEHLVYAETRSIIGGMVYEGGNVSGLSCDVRSAEDHEVAVFRSSLRSDYEVGPYAGVLMFEFEVDRAGRYRLRCAYRGGVVGQKVVMAVSPGQIGSVASVLAIAAPALGVAAAALALAIWLARRHHGAAAASAGGAVA
jgi:hypothetical protein